MEIREHYHADHSAGAVLSESCNACGCGYYYCDGCLAVEESHEMQEGCSDPQCDCHTDARRELD